jgi:hypothetical protein
MKKIISLVAMAAFLGLAFGSKGNPEYRECYDSCVSRKNAHNKRIGVPTNNIDRNVCATRCDARHSK